MSSQPTAPPGSGVFVGREEELRTLELILLPFEGGVAGKRVCAISGMAGVGKTSLVEHFVRERARQHFKLILRPHEERPVSTLYRAIIGPAGDHLSLGVIPQIHQALRDPTALFHIENIDSDTAAMTAVEMVRSLPDCAIVVTGRFRSLGRSAGWSLLDMKVPGRVDAIEQIRRKLHVNDDKDIVSLVESLGRLPLAIHIAAGHMNTGLSVGGFLRRFWSSGLSLPPGDPADPLFFQDRERAIVSTSLEISLQILERSFGDQAEIRMASFAKLGQAVGVPLTRREGADITKLSEEEFEDILGHAVPISLAERGDGYWCLHPLVARLLQTRSTRRKAGSSSENGLKIREDSLLVRSRVPRLKFLSVRNFKSIPALDVNFVHASALSGNWTCIAGVNGAGKSAVLQAIALVLLGDRLSLVIGDQWLDRARRRTGEEAEDAEIRATVQIGMDTLEVVLPIGAGRIDLEKAIPDHEQREKIKAFWDERERDHLLLSYGAGRNLSEYVDSRHGSKGDDVKRQMTLFDPLTQVASVEVLLKQAPKHASILVLLKSLLSVILEGTALAVAPSDETLRFLVNDAIVDAAELPDGFRATIAWLADLCAAWCAKAPYEAQSGDPAQIRAIVLIDEIDLHLHPRLQRVLVPRLRKALPEVQWIVTTHSPLVLSSFDKSELVLLDVDAPGGKRLLDRQILGFTMDEVYEWLMETEPRSAALEDKLENSDGDAEARLALILAQSPEVSEEDATDNRAFRQALAQKIREQQAEEQASANGGKSE